MDKDVYKTIESPAEAIYKDKGSKFLTYAYPVKNENEIEAKLEPLRKKFYDATHHCYAWRLGPQGEKFRVNDDGEPSGTAGKPIYGQMLSQDITDILIVVIRYFGGTKLGVPGLINAYRQSAKEVIDNCRIVAKTVDAQLVVHFSYIAMNGIMKVIKEYNPKITGQQFDNMCSITLAIRKSNEKEFISKIEKCGIDGIDHNGYI